MTHTTIFEGEDVAAAASAERSRSLLVSDDKCGGATREVGETKCCEKMTGSGIKETKLRAHAKEKLMRLQTLKGVNAKSLE